MEPKNSRQDFLAAINDLKGKFIWELSPSEADFIFRHLHMDHYVHASFMLLHNSSDWSGKKLIVREKYIPAYLAAGIKQLAGLTTGMGHVDPGKIRGAYTHLSYQLFSHLAEVKRTDLTAVIDILAQLAWLATAADKNGGLPVWEKPVIRDLTPGHSEVFTAIEKGIRPEEFFKLPGLSRRWRIGHPVYSPIEEFVIRSVEHIIMMTENGMEKPRLIRAYENTERNMRDYELRNNIGNKNQYPANIKNPYQIRYRNTLYLYGGNLLERMGQTEKAFAWYTKDIYFLHLADICRMYLTTLKTVERLLCAYRLANESAECDEQPDILLEIIHNCLLNAFVNAARYADTVLAYLQANKNFNLQSLHLPIKPDRDAAEANMHFAGEAARELYLSCLLYRKFVLKKEYTNEGPGIKVG